MPVSALEEGDGERRQAAIGDRPRDHGAQQFPERRDSGSFPARARGSWRRGFLGHLGTSGMRLRKVRLTAPMTALKAKRTANCHGCGSARARQAAAMRKVMKLARFWTAASRARYLPRNGGRDQRGDPRQPGATGDAAREVEAEQQHQHQREAVARR